jgi:hypothetical protein
MTTTATVDDRKRVRIPDAEPGQTVTILTSADGWTISKVKPQEAQEIRDPFPPGSLLKYFTKERDELESILVKGCVQGPGPDEQE